MDSEGLAFGQITLGIIQEPKRSQPAKNKNCTWLPPQFLTLMLQLDKEANAVLEILKRYDENIEAAAFNEDSARYKRPNVQVLKEELT